MNYLLLLSHLTDEKKEAKEGQVNLPKVIELASKKARIQIEAIWI